MIKLTEEQKETLSYDDVAYMILNDTNKKSKIQDLFKKVIKMLDLDDSYFENDIGEFFELIVTDKRFTMLDGGYVDLKINHSTKIIIEDEEEDYLSDETMEDIDIDEESIEDEYDDESNPDEDLDDDYDDLVVIDEDSDDLDSDIL